MSYPSNAPSSTASHPPEDTPDAPDSAHHASTPPLLKLARPPEALTVDLEPRPGRHPDDGRA